MSRRCCPYWYVVLAAVATARDTGEFVGKLPVGGYVFGGHPLEVEAGVEIRVELSRRARRQANARVVG